ncbi:hypothetical protein EFV37_22005 [Mesorhizobium loti]|uniref:Uncharacterized protein n=1 Tax=Mesorhizobium jarvisii TaxID=1777867 RepID=A0A6M7TID1_9HYPH|nr:MULTISPECIES: hypothetical protein [Mesorhizobium]OBQ59602.1 hypothetical protein A9K72_25665 [Mesorhizobium loti]QKC64661.1 hypothetical protein EB229_22000 [Mesorhizobium jarvisii]QKD10575.1 hypothetical protein EFV37_22005 [Mesorhizobium loti]RJT30565.1 hypothetical protein D3242_24635 [Mesorhizobium jarvisii]
MTALAAAQVDPSMLSSQQRRAVNLIKLHRLYRRPNGYGKPPASVSLDIVRSLLALGLVRLDTSGMSCPVLTGSGLNLHAVMEQRARKRT